MIPKQAPSQTSSRVPELDGLRGIAILLVVILHFFVKSVSPEPGTALSRTMVALRLAWTGVDLFFVLSGFLIGGILLENAGSPNYFKTFYVRRICRIFPLYFGWVLLFMAVLLIQSSILLQPRYTWLFDKTLPHWCYLTFTQNLEMAQRGSFGSNWLAVTWSLAVEEQFYLVLPILIRFVPARRLPLVLTGLITLAPILRSTVAGGLASYLLMPCRADALLLGVLCACALRYAPARDWIKSQTRLLYFVAGLLGCGMGYLTLKAHTTTSPAMRSWGFTWVAFFYASVLLIAVTETRGLVSRVARLVPLRKVGLVAFGVYLFHQAINGLMHAWLLGKPPLVNDKFDLLVTFGSLSLTLLLAQTSWTFFERPIVAFGHSFKYLRKNPALATARTGTTPGWAIPASH